MTGKDGKFYISSGHAQMTKYTNKIDENTNDTGAKIIVLNSQSKSAMFSPNNPSSVGKNFYEGNYGFNTQTGSLVDEIMDGKKHSKSKSSAFAEGSAAIRHLKPSGSSRQNSSL